MYRTKVIVRQADKKVWPQTGIVYTQTQEEAQRLSQKLKKHFLKRAYKVEVDSSWKTIIFLRHGEGTVIDSVLIATRHCIERSTE